MDYFALPPLRRAHLQPTGSWSCSAPPRDPAAPFFTAASGYPTYFGPRPADHAAQARENQYYADIAASIQAVTEEVVLSMARYAHRRTGLSRLCMAGGVALNSVANGRILRETPFEELYVQPAAGDAGGALGAALCALPCRPRPARVAS